MRLFTFSKHTNGIVSLTTTAWAGSITLARSEQACGDAMVDLLWTSSGDIDHKLCKPAFEYCLGLQLNLTYGVPFRQDDTPVLVARTDV